MRHQGMLLQNSCQRPLVFRNENASRAVKLESATTNKHHLSALHCMKANHYKRGMCQLAQLQK